VATPDEAINTIREVGGAQPGYRALHAKGKLYHGTFTAAADAAQLSRAAHLTGSTVPALIRFSSGSGNPAQPDNAPGVRGLAVKFTLPDGSTTDVSTQTARLFPASTPEGFLSLLRASKPGVTAPLRLAGYIATHPRFLSALPVVRDANKVPVSYGTVAYHGLHAFRADFLIDELDERLTSGPVRFAYQVQIAAEGDSLVDPSRPWHSTKTVTVGTIDITGVETQREHGGDIVVFDPMRVTDGIEPSDDPVLRFRTLAYSASVKLRTGVDRGPEAPPS
jgi:catalase